MSKNINFKDLKQLIAFSEKYQINIQFWPKFTAVYIAKGGIDLADFGGDASVISDALEYLKRITQQ